MAPCPPPAAAPDDDDESSTTNGEKVDVFVEQWVSVICGMTAHGMLSRFEIFESARHFRIEFESGRPSSNSIRISKLRRSLIFYFYGMIQPICAESAVKHQLTN